MKDNGKAKRNKIAKYHEQLELEVQNLSINYDYDLKRATSEEERRQITESFAESLSNVQNYYKSLINSL